MRSDNNSTSLPGRLKSLRKLTGRESGIADKD